MRIATALLEASNTAASIATEYQTWMEGDNIFNRWKLMFMDVFIKIFTGLEILGMSIANEVDGEWRHMDNRVCIWLSDLLVVMLSPRVSNLESCVSRWIENIHLWSTRNYPPHMYLGLLGRLPRAIVDMTPRKEVAFATSSSTSTSVRSGLPSRQRSRTATRSKSVERTPLATGVSKRSSTRGSTTITSPINMASRQVGTSDENFEFPEYEDVDASRMEECTTTSPDLVRQSRSRDTRP